MAEAFCPSEGEVRRDSGYESFLGELSCPMGVGTLHTARGFRNGRITRSHRNEWNTWLERFIGAEDAN